MKLSDQQTMAPLSRTTMTSCSFISKSHEKESLSEIIDEATRIMDGELDSDENDSESPSSSSGPQRAVTFAITNKLFEIMSLEDYSEKEIRRCWYSPEEKEKMNHSKDKLVARMEAGKPLKGDMTYRGLECWTTAGGEELDANIARVVDAVMDEQDRQWAENNDDFELIAKVSSVATSGSAELAREIAVQDEKEAKSAWETMEDMSVTSMHSSNSLDVPANARKERFCVLKRRSSSKSKKRTSETPEENTQVPAVSDDDSCKSKSSKDKRSKSRDSKHKKSKKDPKKSRRSSVDPPAPVKRTTSQDASDILLKMLATSRHLNAIKL